MAEAEDPCRAVFDDLDELSTLFSNAISAVTRLEADQSRLDAELLPLQIRLRDHRVELDALDQRYTETAFGWASIAERIIATDASIREFERERERLRAVLDSDTVRCDEALFRILLQRYVAVEATLESTRELSRRLHQESELRLSELHDMAVRRTALEPAIDEEDREARRLLTERDRIAAALRQAERDRDSLRPRVIAKSQELNRCREEHPEDDDSNHDGDGEDDDGEDDGEDDGDEDVDPDCEDDFDELERSAVHVRDTFNALLSVSQQRRALSARRREKGGAIARLREHHKTAALIATRCGEVHAALSKYAAKDAVELQLRNPDNRETACDDWRLAQITTTHRDSAQNRIVDEQIRSLARAEKRFSADASEIASRIAVQRRSRAALQRQSKRLAVRSGEIRKSLANAISDLQERAKPDDGGCVEKLGAAPRHSRSRTK